MANEKLYQKLKAEYDSFIADLKNSTPETIIEKSYEKVFKEEILGLFENGDINLDCKQVKAVLANKCPLDAFYQEWLNKDCSFLDMLRDCIDDRVNSAVEDMKKRDQINKESR